MSTLQTQLVKKTAIINSGDFNLSAARYLELVEFSSEYEAIQIGDICKTTQGVQLVKKDQINDHKKGYVRYLYIQDFKGENRSIYVQDKYPDKLLSKDDLVMANTGTPGAVFKGKNGVLSNNLFKITFNKLKINRDYLYSLLSSSIFQSRLKLVLKGGVQKHLGHKAIKEQKIPLPPLEIQEQIVKEIEGYQQIIDGCRQVVENYKPVIDIDPNWDMVELGEAYESNFNAKRIPITKSDRKKGDIPYYGASGIVDYVRDFIFDEELLLVSEDGANLKDRNFPIAFSISGKSWVNNHAHVLKFRSYENQKFIEFYLNNISLEPYITGSAQPKVNQRALNSIKVPNPSMEIQREIVQKLEQEKEVIEGNKELIKIYEKKINDKIKELF